MTAREVARRLPDIPALRDLCRSMAVLDAVLRPDGAYRRHGFDPRWAPGRQLAWMDNGAGDEYSLVLSAEGAYLCGFDHESPLNPYALDEEAVWPGVLDTVPEAFRDLTEHPRFIEDGIPLVTACLWREADDERWHTGAVDFDGTDDVPDGASYLFRLLTDGGPEQYHDWARDYFGRPLPLDAVRHVFALRPLTFEVAAALNPEVTREQLDALLTSTGYPPAADGAR
ncbi:hypothetical protein ACWEQL_41760 [Kitasatospora sp. NPDC004240]